MICKTIKDYSEKDFFELLADKDFPHKNMRYCIYEVAVHLAVSHSTYEQEFDSMVGMEVGTTNLLLHGGYINNREFNVICEFLCIGDNNELRKHWQKSYVDSRFDTVGIARQLAEHRNTFVRATIQAIEKEKNHPNQIYSIKEYEIKNLSRTVADQKQTIEALTAERDKLGMFKGKEKKELQGNIDVFEKSRRDNIEKLKRLGVSDPSKANEMIKELRQILEQNEQEYQNIKARATEEKTAFLNLSKYISKRNRGRVLAEMKKYITERKKGYAEYEAEWMARLELDTVFNVPSTTKLK